jgi:DNA (cytosine-5)-methyltransferase 3A
MSCGQVALKELGIPINKYFAYEIKPSAIYATQLNFPNTIQLGDLTKFDISQLQGEKIDLLLCGSPCQNMSLINITGKTGVEGEKSILIYACTEIMKLVKPKYFLFENVKSMNNHDKTVFNSLIGCEPIHIDSGLLSAQTRNRYYWTNIPVETPKDKGIFLKDILDKNPKKEEKWSDKKIAFVNRKRNNTMYVRVNGEKSIPITARGYAAWNTQFIEDSNGLRDLTINEYRRLQTIPEWYNFGDLRKSKITDLIGDGWTVDVIVHIFKNL